MPLADILLITPPENARIGGNVNPMDGYARIQRQLAQERWCAHLNLQFAFGRVPADYALSGRNWFGDDIHSDNGLYGRHAINSAVTRILTK